MRPIHRPRVISGFVSPADSTGVRKPAPNPVSRFLRERGCAHFAPRMACRGGVCFSFLPFDTVTVTYDALGRMVEQDKGGTYFQILYSPTGFKMHTMSGQTPQEAFSPLPGGAEVDYTSIVTYRHGDWLGSSRLTTTASRTVYYDGAYGPFGEPYAQSGTSDLNFTSKDQGTAANVYDFPAREYGIQGRWPSPDPAGLAAVNPMDPQTWNRYAYVRNNPLSMVDPFGFDSIPVSKIIILGEGTCGPICWPNNFDYSFVPGTGFGMSNGMFGNLSLGPNPFGGGGSSNPPTPQSPAPSRAVCAANLADKYSIAGAVGTIGKQGFFANVFNGFAGNTFSGVTLAFSGGGNKYRLGTSINNATFGGTASAINAVTTPAPITELGLTETVGGEFLGKGLGGIFTVAKLGYDAASFGIAYYECGK